MADREGVVTPRNWRSSRVKPERWKQVEAVFEQAVGMTAEARPAFLEQTCDGDIELRREVESLLVSHAGSGDFLDRRSLFFSGEAFEEAAGALAEGELIGPYRVLREIGRGGMGAVYLAERADEQYQKRVAIKLIKRGMDTDAVLRHFRNERQILARFDHPNIARLFDGGTTADGLPYFVMEYVEGVPIDLYAEQHALSIPQRLHLFREVCAAVSYAHRHAVIHRDLKPSNILVTSEGIPKLLDFGIAKILQPSDSADALVTATGARPMTPEFASPEQVRGDPVTTASDVYSLGVVLYELLTGSLPYALPSRSSDDIAKAITTSPPRKPSVVSFGDRNSVRAGLAVRNRKSLRGDLDNIVLMALRKEPARRYQSVEQFSEDIQRHLDARPIAARKDTVAYRAAKFIQRNKALSAAAAIAILAVLGGLVATTWQTRRAERQKTRAERRFNDVRQLARSVLFDYHDLIKDLPGATKARERLVKDALAYLDSLAAEATGDTALQRELAAAYERVGDVRGAIYQANLGDRAGAAESYEKARCIRETLVALAPRDLVLRRELAANYRKLGNLRVETSEAAQGLEQLRKSLALSTELLAQNSTDPELRSEVAEICNALGLALEDRGEFAEAVKLHRQALPLREEASVADPQNPQAKRDLSVTLVNLGRALFFSGDIAGAIEMNQKALALRSALVAADPTNADYRRLLAVSYQNDGDYRAFVGDYAAALESFRKKIVLDEKSLSADPANVQVRRDFAYSCERIAELLWQLGNYAEALPSYQQALATRELLIAADPKNLPFRLGLILAHAELARVEARLGNRAVALAECKKTTALLQETIDDPTDAAMRGLRARSHTYLGETYGLIASGAPRAESEAHWRAARSSFQESLNIWEDLRQRGTLAADDANKADQARREIAECEAALAQLHEPGF